MKNKVSTTIWTFAAFLCAMTAMMPESLQAAKLHVLLVGDTLDDSLGIAFNSDLDMMQGKMKEVAEHTDLELNLTIITDDSVKTENILNYLTALEVDSDDVMVMYFTMHGYRTASKESQWPNLYFGVEHMGMDFAYINQLAKEKSPRFLLSLADSCNNEIPEDMVPTISQKAYKALDMTAAERLKQNYRKLFLESYGSVVISSSIPGQYSWAYVFLGGIYSLSFLDVMEQSMLKAEVPDWHSLLADVSHKVLLETATFNEQQDPQYEVLFTDSAE